MPTPALALAPLLLPHHPPTHLLRFQAFLVLRFAWSMFVFTTSGQRQLTTLWSIVWRGLYFLVGSRAGRKKKRMADATKREKSPGNIPVFIYGSLQSVPVLECLLSRVPRLFPAEISGFVRLKVRVQYIKALQVSRR